MPHALLTPHELAEAITALQQGQLIAYATESIFGLGCDPRNEQAVHNLLALKQRPQDKGLILVAASLAQVLPYIKWHTLSLAQQQRITQSWPGPVTWLIPASSTTPAWLTGQHSTIAIRLSAHPTVQQLCQAWNQPLVSTSANRSGQTPAKDYATAQALFGSAVAYYVPSTVGGRTTPSTIRDALTGQQQR